jgi:surface protein
MEYMFYECNSLISLNLNNFDTSKLTKWSGMFYNFNSSLVYCINNESMATRIQSDTTSDKQYSLEDSQNICPKICYNDKYFYCLKDKCPDEYKFLILETKECIINCSYDQIYKYEYNNTCIDFLINDTNNNIYSEYLNIDENITSTELTELVSKDINTYLFDINDESEEKNNYFSDILSEKINNKFGYNILEDLSIINNKSITINDSQINEIIEKLRDILLDISYENLISEIKEGEDIIIENEKIILSITSTENQRYNFNKNMSTIELGECENNLIFKN